MSGAADGERPTADDAAEDDERLSLAVINRYLNHPGTGLGPGSAGEPSSTAEADAEGP